jgi:hypothetical protein
MVLIVHTNILMYVHMKYNSCEHYLLMYVKDGLLKTHTRLPKTFTDSDRFTNFNWDKVTNYKLFSE